MESGDISSNRNFEDRLFTKGFVFVFKEKSELNSEKNKLRRIHVIIFLSLLTTISLLVCCQFLILTHSKNNPKRWENLNSAEQVKILNQNLNFPVANLKLKDFFDKDSSCLNELKSWDIYEGLDNKSSALKHALRTYLISCVNLNYQNMTKEIKKKFLYSKVNFQASKVIILDLFDENSAVYNNFSSDQILTVLDEQMIIDMREKFSYDLYVDREITSKDKSVKKTLYDIIKMVEATKIFIFADDIGTGKTVAMKKFTTVIKTRHPSQWVSYIDAEFFNFEELNLNDLEMSLLKQLNVSETDVKYFNEFFKNRQIVLVWDHFEKLLPEKKQLFLEFIIRLKNIGIVQVIATNRESSRMFEKTFDVETYEFVPFSKHNRNEFITRYQRKYGNFDHDPAIEKIEDYFENEVMGNAYNFMSKNSPLFITLMISAVQKLNYKEIFNSAYLLYENHLKIGQISNNLKLIHQRKALKSLSNGTILNFTTLEVEKDVDDIFAHTRIHGFSDNVEFFHSSVYQFFILHNFLDTFEALDHLYYSQIELNIKLLLYFSNFHDDKLIRNLMSDMTFHNFNPKVKIVMAKKFENVLYKFNATENPAIFVNFFKHDREILTIIGSPRKWLEQHFNISINNATLDSENSSIWPLYEVNHQKGIIFYQLWRNRNFKSVNAILAFTEIKMSEEFLLDLLATDTFMNFYELTHLNLNNDEFKQLFLQYMPDIFGKYLKNSNDIETVWKKVLSIYSKQEIRELFLTSSNEIKFKVENDENKEHLMHLISLIN